MKLFRLQVAVIVIGTLAAAAAPALAAPKDAAAKDWSQMNIKERLAWADAFAKQACPNGIKVSDSDTGRKSEIGAWYVPQLAVKINIKSRCK